MYMDILLFLSMGSVQADIQVLAIINTNTTRKIEALNHLVQGFQSRLVEGLNLTAVRILGNQAERIALS